VYLGYRLGAHQERRPVFRALVYNKGAAVLHMLRNLIGDDAFLQGLRRFTEKRGSQKAGTGDLRHAMERKRPVLGTLLRAMDLRLYAPSVMFDFRVEPRQRVRASPGRFEQSGEIFDLPITVTLQYADRRNVDILVPVTDRVVEKRVALDGTLRSAEINKEDGALVEVLKAN
jgi:hypothetical protein